MLYIHIPVFLVLQRAPGWVVVDELALVDSLVLVVRKHAPALLHVVEEVSRVRGGPLAFGPALAEPVALVSEVVPLVYGPVSVHTNTDTVRLACVIAFALVHEVLHAFRLRMVAVIIRLLAIPLASSRGEIAIEYCISINMRRCLRGDISMILYAMLVVLEGVIEEDQNCLMRHST